MGGALVRRLNVGRAIGLAALLVQLWLAARVLLRLARTTAGMRLTATSAPIADRITAIVPVLNERARLAPCLDGLLAQGQEVAEILVVDGGSTDGTRELVTEYAERDRRVRWLDATPVPEGENGKAHNLQTGLDAANPAATWILTIDADVRPHPALATSLVHHARRAGVCAFSVATEQRLSGWAEALLHPALLTTLVYRFGIPGHVATHVAGVQANGQCFFVRRQVVEEIGGFAATRHSVCEDVTLARALVTAGKPVGFYEGGELVETRMYAGWWDAWRNWTRSLPMRDQFAGGLLGLVEVSAVQALPPVLFVVWALRQPRGAIAQVASKVNAILTLMRLGVLVGTARAYPDRPWSYWLSPVCDLPAALGVWFGVARRQHTWRGRSIVRGGPR